MYLTVAWELFFRKEGDGDKELSARRRSVITQRKMSLSTTTLFSFNLAQKFLIN